jgi:hypothetical protein
MQVKRLMIYLGLLVFLGAAKAGFGVQSGSQSRPQASVSEEWVKENYAAILHAVLPKRLELLPFPGRTKWVTVVLIEEPFLRSEYWVLVSKDYEGSVGARIKIAHGRSLARQIRELREANPDASKETISEMVQVDTYEITDKDAPKLKDLANALEQIRVSPIAPDLMGPDLFAYHYWTEAQYGQEISAQLVGYGPDSKKQPHALVEWAEQVRALTAGYIELRSGGKPKTGH